MNDGSRPVRDAITTTQVKGGAERSVNATVRLDPPDAAQDAEWFNITSWQGKQGRSHVDTLRRVGPGTYVSRKPILVHGTWKTTLRLAKGREVVGLPIFLPRDAAIPGAAGAEVPATSRFTRTFALDKKNLQREQKAGVSSALTTGAYLAVLAIYLVLLGVLAWGLTRLERTVGGPPQAHAEAEPAPRSRVQPGGAEPTPA
jgi:hypothetical protein